MVVIAISISLIVMFISGYFIGHAYGYSKCWYDMTKDDKWRNENTK